MIPVQFGEHSEITLKEAAVVCFGSRARDVSIEVYLDKRSGAFITAFHHPSPSRPGGGTQTKDLKHPAVLWLKGTVFLGLGVTSAPLPLAEAVTIKVAFLLALTVWAFCRAYYFAFYVIARYVDPTYRFSGLWSVAGYLPRKKRPD